jgi:hypothetical protein
MAQHPSVESLLGFFEYDHLPPSLQTVSKPLCDVAHEMADNTLLSGPELAAGLRKLLDAKDCLVRATLPPKPAA